MGRSRRRTPPAPPCKGAENCGGQSHHKTPPTPPCKGGEKNGNSRRGLVWRNQGSISFRRTTIAHDLAATRTDSGSGLALEGDLSGRPCWAGTRVARMADWALATLSWVAGQCRRCVWSPALDTSRRLVSDGGDA